MRESLRLDDPHAAWLLSAYVVGTLVGNPGNAWIAARWGAARALSLALVTYAAGGVLLAFSHDAALACVARWTQGLGAGSLLAIATATLAQSVTEARRGRAIVLLALAYGVAFLVSSGASSSFGASWRGLYLALSALALVAAGLSVTALRAPPPTDAAPFDSRGFALWSGAVASLAVVIPQTRGGAVDTTTVALALTSAAVMFALCVRHARRVTQPFVPLGLVRERRVLAACALSLAAGVGQVFAVSLPSFAAVVIGVERTRVSLWSLPFVLAGLVGTVAAAVVIDRLGPRRVVVVTGLTFLVGAFALSVAPASRPVFASVSALIGLGLCTLSSGPIRHLVGVVEGPDAARAQSLLALVTNLGLLASSGLYGALASPRGDDLHRALAMRHGSAAAAALFAVTLAVGLALSRPSAE
jgi:MFS family permease